MFEKNVLVVLKKMDKITADFIALSKTYGQLCMFRYELVNGETVSNPITLSYLRERDELILELQSVQFVFQTWIDQIQNEPKLDEVMLEEINLTRENLVKTLERINEIENELIDFL